MEPDLPYPVMRPDRETRLKWIQAYESAPRVQIPDSHKFGMAPIESMAAGKPVIGVAEGGLLETVVDGETGILIKADPSPEDVIQAVHEMTAKQAKDMREACERRAKLFDKDVFINKIREVFGG